MSSISSHFGWLNTCHLSPNGWQKVRFRYPWDEWNMKFLPIFISNSSMLPNPCEGFTRNSSRRLWHGLPSEYIHIYSVFIYIHICICSPCSAKICKVWMDCHGSWTKKYHVTFGERSRDIGTTNPCLRVRVDTCCFFAFATWYVSRTLTCIQPPKFNDRIGFHSARKRRSHFISSSPSWSA